RKEFWSLGFNVNHNVLIPRPETETIVEQVVRRFKGKGSLNILDIGTGSGVLAVEAAKNAETVVGVDIDEKAIKYCKKNVKDEKIRFFKGNLFKDVKGKFDLIVFNPPYLPKDKEDKDIAHCGGKHGYEVVERFIREVGDYLEPDGKVLLLFSSLTNKEKVDGFVKENLLGFELLEEKSFFFEKLYVYLLWKSEILVELEKRFEKIKFLERGHRGMLFTGKFDGKKVAIKVKNPESEAIERIGNERNWLERLNNRGIGPKLLVKEKEYFAYRFVEGEFILDFLGRACKRDIVKVITAVFEQLFVLDKLGVNKEEMHHPVKHVIVGKNLKVTLLDFERCHRSLKPKNVTQFCQFVCLKKVSELLKKKKIKISMKKMIKSAKMYKGEMSEESLEGILENIK
ncbi:MAG: methyltransferase, partial [Candidatus Woesearchaeota archaeon]|nr:methyltransferase [Candidatus Woesearchaeota archaeon]